MSYTSRAKIGLSFPRKRESDPPVKPELAGPVRTAARALQVGFAQEPFSVEAILRGFGLEPGLAAELAADLEEALRLGRQAQDQEGPCYTEQVRRRR